MTPLTSPRRPTRSTHLPSHWTRGVLMLAAGLMVGGGCDDSSGGTGVNPDYTLSLAPATLTIEPGSAANSTVTIDRTDFDGEVTLSVTGAPVGISGSFAPSATTGISSMFTVGVSLAASPGDYTIVVRGNGAAGSRAATFPITVSQPLPSFELAVDPAILTIGQGDVSTTGVNITRTDFAGAVTLTLLDAPPGVTGSFDPVAPMGSGSVLTVTVGAAVPPGNYDVTVVGTGSVGTSSAGFLLTVTP